ncbi:MAG: site-specific integrase [Deltaproteobacteria bacterium]|nr:site-specific integrase [Deltaproteobacteria bacterium]
MAIRKRGDRYFLDFYDQHGERQRLTLPKGTSKAKAKEELRAIEEQVQKGIFAPEKRTPTFSEVAKDWIEYKRPKLRETTWECYDGHVRNHFAELNELKINRITTASIEKYITAMQLNRTPIGTIRKVLVTLGQILSYAVRHKYVDHNPLRDAERPRDPGEGKKEIKVLKPEEIQALLENTQSQRYRTLFLVAIMTGARQGELLGLQWEDLDLENKQLNIQRTYTKGRFFNPKTKTSNRAIDLSPLVISELKRWKLACPPSEMDLMFPNEEGKPINYSNMVNRHFIPALKATGIPTIRFHDLRHTNASIRLDQGENVKYVQTQMGHSSPMVTLNVYAHLLDKRNQEAAHRLEAAIFGNRAQNGHKN